MPHPETLPVLDREQLREVTLDDPDLMRDFLAMLIEDTSRQIQLLERAVEEGDLARCRDLAHYSHGACANVGARSAAALLRDLEGSAASANYSGCASSIKHLSAEIERLRTESAALL